MTLQKLEALADRLEAELAHRHRGTLELPKSRDAYEDGLRLCHEARAEIAALRVAGEGWQDISTAPRDGTHFLACDASQPYAGRWGFNQNPPVVAHYWDNPGEEGFYLSRGGTEDDDPLSLTHWRPLPAPPKETE